MVTNQAADSATPIAVSTSTIRILGVDLVVHVLDTGARVIDADSFGQLLSAMEFGDFSDADALALAKFVKGVE